MNEYILKKVYEDLELGNRVCFVTLTDVKGSSPGKQGAVMAVFKDDSVIGTIGGGILENVVINKCRECIKTGEDFNFDYSLTEESLETTMKCGGYVKGYIKVFKPKPKLLIIGGGHIGHSLYNISKGLDFYSTIVDDRQEFANENRFPDADEVYSGDISEILNKINIDDNTYIVIATRGYEKDIEALREVINSKAAYIGMIGSRKKWKALKEELISEGVEKKVLESIYAPVGINISSSSVSEIAFGIMAEILLVKNNGDLSHRKDKR